MSRLIDSMSAINSFIRTLLALIVVGSVGTASYFAYTTFNAKRNAESQKAKLIEKQDRELAAARNELEDKDRQLNTTRDLLESTVESLKQTQHGLEEAESELNEKLEILREKQAEIVALNKDLADKQEALDRTQAAMRLLKVTHRLARLTVVDQGRDADSGGLFSDIEFVELNDQGMPIDEAKRFRIQGDVVYLDNWVVKFEDRYVEQADLDRATSLVLFRRIFGEFQEPSDGFRLDEVGERPRAYGQHGEATPFEREIWRDFWSIANDEAKAKALGIRAAHGEAPSIKVQKGKSYRVLLRASDGLSIQPDVGG